MVVVLGRIVVLLLVIASSSVALAVNLENGLVGHWKLQGDCRDSTVLGNHGINHDVDLKNGSFDGIKSYIEVPASDSLKLGTGDFTICASVYTKKDIEDVIGDVLDFYDPDKRRGITLSINGSAGGFQSQGTDRHVYFGIDNGHLGEWRDCGRPSSASNYVSESMTVFKGKLYAATTGGKTQSDWAHVYQYEGGDKWVDCGQVGGGGAQGVGPLIVHNGDLYAVTWTVDWTRVKEGGFDPGRVYRYLGGTQWEDCGQPSDNRTLNCIASYRGKLFVGGGWDAWGVYTQDIDKRWKPSVIFDKTGPRRCFPHSMAVFNGKLFTGYPVAYAFDGKQWTYVGQPFDYDNAGLQLYCFAPYQGKLCVGSWPEGKVAVYEGGEKWSEIGRLGEDGTEVNGLVVYNGKLYGGTLPRAEVCRYEGDSKWTSLKRFYSPDDWKPGIPYKANRKEVNEWVRLTSLTVYDGKLFASTGSCTSSVDDAPIDIRGKVFSIEAGTCVSYDNDLGAGWRHIVAMRDGRRLKLFVDGALVAQSTPFEPADYDLTTDRPLRIGFGQTDYFSGRIADVRIYNRALSSGEVKAVATRTTAKSAATNRFDAHIILGRNASRVDRFAAAELQRSLNTALGWQIDVSQSIAPDDDVPSFFVGSLDSGVVESARSLSLPSEELEKLDIDGVLIKGNGRNLALVGKGLRGGLNAVYEFLEKSMGCRWPEPGREFIPKRESIDWGIHCIHVPRFVYRGIGLHGPCSDDYRRQIIDWMAKNRLNTLQFSCEVYEQVRPKILDALLDRGLHPKIGAHSRQFFYPSEKYFPKNPEQFAIVEGKRTGDTQLCYSNHASAEPYAQNVIDYLKSHPEIGVVGLWPSDGYGFCECEKCKSRATTDVLLDYINNVAQRVHEQAPKVKIEFLSYIHYTTPPDKVSPLPYVVPTYCEYWARNQFHPITDNRASNSKCREQLEEWVRRSHEATVYSYYADDTMKRFLYNGVPDVVLSDLAYYKKIGAAGATVLVMCPESWWSHGPHMYAFARGAWNGACSVDVVCRDYYTSLYGPAAESMIAHQAAARALFDLELGHGETGEAVLFGFRIRKFDPAEEQRSKAAVSEQVDKMRACLASARAKSADPWVGDRVSILDEDARLMEVIYGVLNESAGYKSDHAAARKASMRSLMSALDSNEVATKHDYRCKILKSLMPHAIAVLGDTEAAVYDRVAFTPIE